jgi:hypothetical protein
LLKGLVEHLLHVTGRSHLASFLQGLLHLGRPSSVAFPPELVEQGAAIALSGLANTMAIQSNPDWVWPSWVVRQTDPEDPAFIPTGLNLITTNLTFRNWTSVGLPQCTREAMVDPVGMVTPGPWSWSALPCLEHQGNLLVPPLMGDAVRQQSLRELPGVRTLAEAGPDLEWEWDVWASEVEGLPSTLIEIRVRNRSESEIRCHPGLSLRPCNALSLGPIRSIRADERRIQVDGRIAVVFDLEIENLVVSDRHHGDPLLRPGSGLPLRRLRSRSGMATAVASWNASIPPGGMWTLHGALPLEDGNLRLPGPRAARHAREQAEEAHRRRMARGTRISVPDPDVQAGWEAVRGRLHVFDDGDRFTPGTFLYHEHWFRDAAFLSLGFENAGLGELVAPKMDLLRTRQKRNGLFRSQTGEWDSNGQAIWTLALHLRRGGDPALAERHWNQVTRGCDWIRRERSRTRDERAPHRGLLPAGFSAEHFGPNDHYFWDDFWSVSALEEAAWMASLTGRTKDAERLLEESADFRTDLEAALAWAAERCGGALPSSPYRRVDAASVGNLVAICPLRTVRPDAPWIGPTLAHLEERCSRDGLHFQSIVHTGLNPYLSAQIARARLAVGDAEGCLSILRALVRAASPTWCWPEAIHPRTRGGCMGDGDHGWAAAEFLSLVRQILVREVDGGLDLLSGVPADWLRRGPIRIWGATTAHGTLDLEVRTETGGAVRAEWEIRRKSHQEPGRLVLVLPPPEGSDLGPRRIPLEGSAGGATIPAHQSIRTETTP